MIKFLIFFFQKPKRYHELTAIHGHLDPLVNVDMEPATHVKVIFFLSFFEKNCAYLPLQAHVTNEGSDIQNLSLGFWKCTSIVKWALFLLIGSCI